MGQVNPISGGIKNEKYDYVHCPYNNWDGWEVDTGAGNWVADPQLKTFCHVGDEGATTNAPPISTTDDGESSIAMSLSKYFNKSETKHSLV